MATNLVISLPADLEAALTTVAKQKGVAPEVLVVDALRDRFAGPARAIEPRDDWEWLILQAGTNCGVSLPDAPLSSKGLYESWRTWSIRVSWPGSRILRMGSIPSPSARS